MRIRSWVLVVALFLGCGEGGEDGEDGESVELEQLASGSSSCPSGGVRVSVGTMSQVICDGERGPAGAVGTAGAAGAMGQAGTQNAQGSALVAQTITACVSLATLPSSNVLANLEYELVTFSDGSVFVSCNAATTGLVGAGHAQFYAGWQRGASDGGCIVQSDASGDPDGGWWDFHMVNGRPHATYHDRGTADDLTDFTFPLADCPTATRPN